MLLALIGELTLRGNYFEAQKVADETLYHFYSNSIPRQEIEYSLRISELHFQKGDFHQALNHASNARRVLTEQSDADLFKILLSLELKIISALNFSKAKIDELKTVLVESTNKASNEYNRRVVSRNFEGEIIWSGKKGSDLVADIIEELKSEKEAQKKNHLGTAFSKTRPDSQDAIKKVLRQGYLTLLIDYFEIKRGQPTLILGAQNKTAILYSPKGLSQFQLNPSGQSFKILKALSKGPQSKKDLIEAIWNYEYSPLRHDPVVYAQINSLRKIMGIGSEYLVSDLENGYSFEGLIKDFSGIVENQSELSMAPNSHLNSTIGPAETTPNTPPQPMPAIQQVQPELFTKNHLLETAKKLDLNHRQLKVLQQLKASDYIGTREHAKNFQISEITANRDLRELYQKKLVARVGKARSTRYTRFEGHQD